MSNKHISLENVTIPQSFSKLPTTLLNHFGRGTSHWGMRNPVGITSLVVIRKNKHSEGAHHCNTTTLQTQLLEITGEVEHSNLLSIKDQSKMRH